MKHSIFFTSKNRFKKAKHTRHKVVLSLASVMLLFLLSVFNIFSTNNFCLADTNDNSREIYLVYDTNNRQIFESNYIEVGDKIIDTNLNEYEIYEVDYDNHVGYAELNGNYIAPKIQNKSKGLNFSNKNTSKSVGLYMTHNDESYVPTDNVSSIYGKGGIHDVAKKLKEEFIKLNYDVVLDESLHLPHDSKAYTRSKTTATNLLKQNLDAIFDIHRDGVERSVYVKNVDGKNRCKVRIVVGQANPQKDANLQFAMYLVSVAKEYCPWLFLDIYYAKGTYNQNLTNKSLLFEMGTYLAEKDLVLETVPYLAKVVDKTLFSTIVDDNSKLTITDTPTANQEEKTVNNVLNNFNATNQSFFSKYLTNIIIFTSVFVVSMVLIIFACNKYNKNKKQLIKENTQNKAKPKSKKL